MTRKILVSTALAVVLMATGIPTAPAATALVPDMSMYNEVEAEQVDTGSYNWRLFREYEMREPCQRYVMPPAPYLQIGCDLYAEAPPPEPVAQTTVTTTVVEQAPQLLPIVSSYVVYFDFDKAQIRADQVETLDLVASEIKKHNPTQITVAGHADTSGAVDYNRTLSQRRAEAVAKALNDRKLANQIIDKEAYGETDLAVPTGDGVKMPENRRVVIDFRR